MTAKKKQYLNGIYVPSDKGTPAIKPGWYDLAEMPEEDFIALADKVEPNWRNDFIVQKMK